MNELNLKNYSNRRIFINVGGRLFETTSDTLKPCQKLMNEIIRCEKPFIDRDPLVFDSMLKFLRGYPFTNILENKDLLYELIHWQHEFVFIRLPKCIENSAKSYDAIAKNIHIPDHSPINRFRLTHLLIPLDIAKVLFTNEEIPNASKPMCDVICSSGWNEHVWIDRIDYMYALASLKYKIYSKQKKSLDDKQTYDQGLEWCLCGKCK